MRFQTITTATLMLLAPLALSAWELENVHLKSYQLSGDAGGHVLDCRKAGRALGCALKDARGRTVAEAKGHADDKWINLLSTSQVQIGDKRRGNDVLLTLSHPKISEDLVLRFAGLAAQRTAANSRTPRGASSNLARRPNPVAGERDEDGPIGPGGMAVAGGTTQVTVQQLGAGGAAQATVPMEHDSCGIDCTTHSLATTGGNLNVPVEITVGCPAGQQVNHVSYQVEGQFVQQLVNAQQPSGSYQQTVQIVPNSEQALETTCRTELGGNWPSNNPHPAVAKHEKALLLKLLTVWGRCTGDGAKTAQQISTKTQLTCVDQDYPIAPVP